MFKQMTNKKKQIQENYNKITNDGSMSKPYTMQELYTCCGTVPRVTLVGKYVRDTRGRLVIVDNIVHNAVSFKQVHMKE